MPVYGQSENRSRNDAPAIAAAMDAAAAGQVYYTQGMQDTHGADIGPDGAGGHVKIRNTSGTLQVVGQDDSIVAVTLGSVAYGQRMILAGMLDDVLDLVGGIDTAGGDVSAPHSGLTDPEPSRVMTGRFINGTIHRLAIVGRAEGQAWPVTMREVYEDFLRGE